jgi:hypothetical protein
MSVDERCTAVNRFGRCRANAFQDGLCAFHRRVVRARKLHGPPTSRRRGSRTLTEIFLAAALRK